MTPDALDPYEGALSSGSRLELVADDGTLVPLHIDRYLAHADDVDQTVIDRSVAPVLDVGCGPGRMVHALAAAGHPVLGLDIAGYAVALTTSRGVPALNRSVFQRVPGEGRWPTVLVLDGNIGIGGDVAALLQRLIALMAPRGSLIVEASSRAPGTDQVLSVRFRVQGRTVGRRFDWAVVDPESLAAYGVRTRLRIADQWTFGGRDFIRFERAALR